MGYDLNSIILLMSCPCFMQNGKRCSTKYSGLDQIFDAAQKYTVSSQIFDEAQKYNYTVST